MSYRHVKSELTLAYCIRVTGSLLVECNEKEAGRYCVGLVNGKVARLDPPG